MLTNDDETIINNNENTSTVNLGHMRPHRLVPTKWKPVWAWQGNTKKKNI